MAKFTSAVRAWCQLVRVCWSYPCFFCWAVGLPKLLEGAPGQGLLLLGEVKELVLWEAARPIVTSRLLPGARTVDVSELVGGCQREPPGNLARLLDGGDRLIKD